MKIMGKYYTNIVRIGNRLLVREIRDGKRRKYKTEYKPTLYIPTKGKTSTLHAPDGTPVESINPGTMGDCYQFIQAYKDVDDFRIFGNTSYEYNFLDEEYPGVLDYKLNEMVVCNLDIEVAKTKDGYSEAKDATNEVIAITMKSSHDGIFHVFACQEFDEDLYNLEHQDTKITYHLCEDEMDLFYKFLDLWETIEPDIVTNWNGRLYDIPYIINRISRIMSPDDAKRLSPWGIIKESTVNIFGKPEVVYDIAGVSILDYLLLYRKNVLEPRESYRLDYIAEVELDEHKVDYGEYNDLQDLYERNFKKFIEYNCLPLNSHIWTSDQIQYLSSLKKGDLLHKSKVYRLFPVTPKQVYQITTSLGTTISTSEDHKFAITSEKSDEIQWLTAGDMLQRDCKSLYLHKSIRTPSTTPLTYRKLLQRAWKDWCQYNHFDFVARNPSIEEHLTKMGCLPKNDTPTLWKYSKLKNFLTDELIDEFFASTDLVTFYITKHQMSYDISNNIDEETLHILGLMYTDGTAVFVDAFRKHESRPISWSISNTNDGIVEFLEKYASYQRNILVKAAVYSSESYTIGQTHYDKKPLDKYTVSFRFNTELGLLYPLIFSVNNTKDLNIVSLSLLSESQFKSLVAGVIDGDGCVSLSSGKSKTTNIGFVNYLKNNPAKWAELFLWNGVLASSHKNRITIQSNGRNNDFVRTLPLKHSLKKDKLPDFLALRRNNDLSSKNGGNTAKVRIHDDYFKIRLENVVKTDDHVDMQDIETSNHEFFVSGVRTHNCNDVRLVDRIDAKRKLIELQCVVAYHAKINFVDVLSQVRMWDTLICNHLLAQGVVVPQKTDTHKDTQFTGAFVMKPIPGMYKWIASFDVQSLYPMIMRTLNMGMETKLQYKDLTPMMKEYQKLMGQNLMHSLDDGSRVVDPNAIVEGMTEELIEHLREYDVAVGANGVFYRRDPKSFYSEMIEELFDNRLEYKAKMKAAKKELSTCNDSIRKAELETISSIFDLKQHATKIILNSLYGCLGNNYARWFDVANAEAVTTTGQFIIQYVARGINAYLNKMMKTTDKQYIVYSDTDSCYVTLETVVDRHHPQGTTMEKVAFVDRICKDALQPQINRLFRHLTDRYLNGVGEYLLMNREVIGDKGIWTAKKRYLINVRDKEGIRKEKAELKVMGLEISKSSVPKFCRDAMKEAVRIVMEHDQETLFKFIADTETKFKAQPIEMVSFPRGVNGIAKYGHHQTIYIKGTPFHTKGALMYNHMLDKKGLSNKYPKIKDGEKIKFFYLKEPNPLGINAMAFPAKLPTELGIDEFIDWDIQFEKSLIEPLKLILSAINWDTQKRASLDALFDWSDDDDGKADQTQYEETCVDELENDELTESGSVE